MTPGQRATVTRRFEPETLAAFSRLVGIDIGTTVPEPLIGALFSYLLGVELPGAGTNYLKQDLVFLKDDIDNRHKERQHSSRGSNSPRHSYPHRVGYNDNVRVW